jgi:hypothetical protein
MNPKKLSPELARWSSSSRGRDRRSVTVQILPTMDPKLVHQKFVEMGCRIESAGRGVMNLVVSPSAVTALSELPWVLSIQEPRVLHPSLNFPR